MIKNKQNSLIYLSFAFSIFDFATTLLNNTIYTFEWVASIGVSTILSFLVLFISLKIKKNSKVINWILIIYSFTIIIRYLIRFSEYIDIKHSTNSLLSISILSFFIIIYLFKFHKESFERISPIILLVVIIMLLMAFVLNYDKIQAVNIYIQDRMLLLNVNIIKVYDWVIPLAILYKNEKCNNKKCYSFLFLNSIILVFISIFRGLCIRGEILYSYSPLHSIFTISKGETIQRFDYIFTVFLIICFFSVLLLNIALINKIKTEYSYISKSNIIILFVVAMIISGFNNIFTNIYLAFVITVLFIAKILKERIYSKNEN